MLEPLHLFILHVLEKVEALLISTFQQALCHIYGVFFQPLCIWRTGFSIFIFILRVFILWVFLKDQQYYFLSSRQIPQSDRQTKKTIKGPIIAKEMWKQNLEILDFLHNTSKTFRLPSLKTCSEVTSFSSTTCRFAMGPKDCFTLGSNIFSLASSWHFLFAHLGSPRILQKINFTSFWTKGLGPAWSEFLFSDLGVGSKVLFCE